MITLILIAFAFGLGMLACYIMANEMVIKGAIKVMTVQNKALKYIIENVKLTKENKEVLIAIIDI